MDLSAINGQFSPLFTGSGRACVTAQGGINYSRMDGKYSVSPVTIPIANPIDESPCLRENDASICSIRTIPTAVKLMKCRFFSTIKFQILLALRTNSLRFRICSTSAHLLLFLPFAPRPFALIYAVKICIPLVKFRA